MLLAEDKANIIDRNSPIAYLTKDKFWLNNHTMRMKQSSNKFLVFLTFQSQQKIGSFFSKLDHLIELQEHKLELLKQKKQAYLQKMFI